MYIDQKLKQYNEREERFRLAVAEATANKSASINSIANKYRVSRTTLSRRIHGFKNTRNSHEKQQKFTNDEENLIVTRVQQILQSSDQIPPKKEVLNICENVLKEKYKDRAPSEGENFFKVGKNWIDRFLERHNDKLMINSTTTLSEYYRSEFLQRKKLRSDRGYKTSTSSTPSAENHCYPQDNDTQAQQSYQYQNAQPQQQSQALELSQHPRMPYQNSENGFAYQTAVDQNQIGNYVQSGYIPHNPSTSYNHDWQFNNFQQRPSIYGQTPQSNGFSYSGAPIQQAQQMPPLLKSEPKQNNSFSNPSYIYGSQTSIKTASPVISNPYTEQSQPQQQHQVQQHQQHQQQHQQQSQALQAAPQQPQNAQLNPQTNPSFNQQQGNNFGAYNFNQQTYPNGTQAEQSDGQVDSLQFYQGQRFQYNLVRQKILKELESEPVDANGITKLINLTFNQIERDLNPPSNNYTIPNY